MLTRRLCVRRLFAALFLRPFGALHPFGATHPSRPFGLWLLAFAAALAWSSPALAQAPSTAEAQEGLKEIQIASGAFVRGAPLPSWAELLPLPAAAERSAGPQRPIVVRLADSHMRAGPPHAYLVNRAEQVNDAAQLGHIGQSTLHFNPAFQRLLLHRILIQRGSESIDHTATAQVRFLQREAALEQGIYSGVITANIVLPDVRVGDTLHLIYTTEGENPIFGSRYSGSASWEQPYPVALRRVTVIAPSERKLNWQWQGGAEPSRLRPSSSEKDGIRRWVFEQRDVPAVDFEQYVPQRVDAMRWLLVSEYQNWSEVAQWATGLFPTDTPLPPELVAVAQRLKALPKLEDRVSQALQWVQSEVRYWSVALGESSHRPALPAEVVQRRWGDCKDKSLLLVRLLKELDIPAFPALASLQNRSGARDWLPTPTAFDHVIVRVPLNGRDYWLDPTRSTQASRLDRLGQHMEEAAVLPVQPQSQALVEIRSPNPELLYASELTERFVLPKFDADAQLSIEQIYVGLAAEGLRAGLPNMDAAQRAKWAIGGYERRYPGITLLEPPQVEDDVAANRLTLRVRYQVPKLAVDAQAFWQMRYFPGNFAGSFAIPQQVGQRKFPLAMPSWPATMTYHVEVQWPESVAVITDPRSQRLDGKHFSVESTRSFRGNLSRHTLVLRPKVNEVPGAEVARLIEDIGKIDGIVGGSMGVAKSAIKDSGFLGIGRTTMQDTMRQRAKLTVERSGKAIEAGRLSGDDLAEALCTRAESRADLGEAAAGLPDAERAVKEAPQSGRAWECRGSLHFANGEFAKSATDYARAMALGADAFNALYRRGHARFYEGKLDLAAQDFAKAAADKEDASDRLFAQLWQLWTLQRLKQPLPPELDAAARKAPRGDWPRPALAMLVGALSVEDMLRWIDERKKGDERELALAEAWFYVGQRQLVNGDAKAAQQSFEKARAQNITMYIEHVAAGWELKALGVSK